jgi:hypothetical protein
MKRFLPMLALVTTTANANLIEKMINHKSNTINVDGMQMEMVESTVFPGSFYYKLVSKKPTHGTISSHAIENIRKDLTAAGYNNVKITHTTSVVDPPGHESETEKQTEPEANKHTQEEEQDPYVLEARRAYEEAQKRLQQHREYMNRVRESRHR